MYLLLVTHIDRRIDKERHSYAANCEHSRSKSKSNSKSKWASDVD